MLEQAHSLSEKRNWGSPRHGCKLDPQQLHLHRWVVHEHMCQGCRAQPVGHWLPGEETTAKKLTCRHICGSVARSSG